ncbi:hypothetical protein FGG08_001723 [Glutinoglossum americanum]|uniref:Argininosuccinate synthase n=1 Tax=Glutinoglossum americanum TaxID=1670608 RepID=A0A9P8ID44_9PEZI|nr:hypothetical protein FGG08_001723 [Glutinoglossum americanum]
MTTIGSFKVPKIENEPNARNTYELRSRSLDRAKLEAAVGALKRESLPDVPLFVAGEAIRTKSILSQRNPSSHASPITKYSSATAEHVSKAIDHALKAKSPWERLPFSDRAAVFLRAADLISGKYRYELMAATMLGQGKNAWQAEIDAAAELVDFLRFNVQYAEELYAQQPTKNSPGIWNRVEYRPLEGFVYAVTPFNFTAIAGNLPCAPALMGNVVVWKPSPAAIASNWVLYSILLEAGLPPNVIQFVPGDAEEVTRVVLDHPEFACLHYTGSTAVFRTLYGKIAEGVAKAKYKNYPRIVGETGGKNFHLIHNSADVENAVINTVRGAFEYQGQKCSATSRTYVPKSVWETFKKQLIGETEKLKVGPPECFENFIGPVIHEASFDRLASVIDEAKGDDNVELLTGGKYDKSVGYFIYPTIYKIRDPKHPLLSRELFGPILAIHVYEDESFESICRIIDETSEYSLTGSIFAKSREAIRYAEEALRNSAGNFYVNCKSTGAVVAQQPFGGARASGTNDKAGSITLLSRFTPASLWPKRRQAPFCPPPIGLYLLTQDQVCLAYSGGLDTSCILAWLIEKGYSVICFMADVGQEEDFEAAEKKALKVGAEKVYIEDLRREFIEELCFPAIQCNAVYEDIYLLGTSLARPVIARSQMKVAEKEGCVAVSHGATGKGNDAVRLELAYYALSPQIQVIAPWRIPEFYDRFAGRSDLLEYASVKNIPVSQTKAKPWSMDENLAHCSYEAGILEDPDTTPPDDMWKLTVDPMKAPDTPEDFTIFFEKGLPVKLTHGKDGKEVVTDSVDLFLTANTIARRHGVGRVDIVENRFIGIKSRGCYETPGLTCLRSAHIDLEGLVMDKEVRALRDQFVTFNFAKILYNGLWFSPEREFLESSIVASQKTVNGQVRCRVYKGHFSILGRSSQTEKLYDMSESSMDEIGSFAPTDTTGFISVQAIRLKKYGQKALDEGRKL